MKTRKEQKSDSYKELTDAISELKLSQDKLEKIVRKINKDERLDTKQQKDELAIPRTKLRIGDKVQIINAKEYQEDRGIITGFKVGEPFVWIWIKPVTGVPIKRIARNLRKID